MWTILDNDPKETESTLTDINLHQQKKTNKKNSLTLKYL